MKRKRYTSVWCAFVTLLLATTSYALTVVTGTYPLANADSEQFWVQVPTIYNPFDPPPLIIGCHGFGGNYMEFANGTEFESYADTLGWLALSITGVPTTYNGYNRWWSRGVQDQLDLVLDSIARVYPFDEDRIYIVGGSMGGAAGMQYQNNHLDPERRMVAISAGGSGIIDMARRVREQGSNTSMRMEFGGPPDSTNEINFEYKRNSGVVFLGYDQLSPL